MIKDGEDWHRDHKQRTWKLRLNFSRYTLCKWSNSEKHFQDQNGGKDYNFLVDCSLSIPQELRQMEMQMTRPGMGARSATMIGNDIAPAQLKAEHILLKRKNQLLLKKEKRIQVSW